MTWSVARAAVLLAGALAIGCIQQTVATDDRPPALVITAPASQVELWIAATLRELKWAVDDAGIAHAKDASGQRVAVRVTLEESSGRTVATCRTTPYSHELEVRFYRSIEAQITK